jgi:hypothetical protein
MSDSSLPAVGADRVEEQSCGRIAAVLSLVLLDRPRRLGVSMALNVAPEGLSLPGSGPTRCSIWVRRRSFFENR